MDLSLFVAGSSMIRMQVSKLHVIWKMVGQKLMTENTLKKLREKNTSCFLKALTIFMHTWHSPHKKLDPVSCICNDTYPQPCPQHWI
jgi:hypothetical protein